MFIFKESAKNSTFKKKKLRENFSSWEKKLDDTHEFCISLWIPLFSLTSTRSLSLTPWIELFPKFSSVSFWGAIFDFLWTQRMSWVREKFFVSRRGYRIFEGTLWLGSRVLHFFIKRFEWTRDWDRSPGRGSTRYTILSSYLNLRTSRSLSTSLVRDFE